MDFDGGTGRELDATADRKNFDRIDNHPMDECPKSGGLFVYLVDPTEPEAEEFGEHLGQCATCRESMARLFSIEEGLSMTHMPESTGSPHPRPEDLYAFTTGQELSAAKSNSIENHLASCAICESELSALTGFDFEHAAFLAEASSSLSMPGATPARDEAGSASLWDGLLAWLGPIEGLMPSPVLTFAALVVLVPVAIYTISGLTGPSPSASAGSLATNTQDSGTQDSSGVRPSDVIAQLEDRGVAQLADFDLPAPSAGRLLEEISQTTERGPTLAANNADPERDLRPVRADVKEALSLDLDPAKESEEERVVEGEVLLASLDHWSIPQFRARVGIEAFEPAPILIRAGRGNGDSTPRVLAPRQIAETIQASPNLYWAMDGQSAAGVEITLVREADREVVLEYQEAGPTAKGLHAISLGERDIRLDVGREYRLTISLVVDSSRRSRDLRAAGAFRRVERSESLSSATLRSDSRGHALATEGLWVDATEFFVELSKAAPNSITARTLRDQFLDGAGVAPPD